MYNPGFPNFPSDPITPPRLVSDPPYVERKIEGLNEWFQREFRDPFAHIHIIKPYVPTRECGDSDD